MARNINIQDGFLFECLKEARPLVFALITGKEIKGTIKRFDRYTILVQTKAKDVLVYKSGLAAVGEDL